MQHEPAFGLHRAAEMHRHFFKFGLVQRNVDLIEHFAQREADRAVQHDAQGTVLVVLAYVGQRTGKKSLLHGWHGNQEMIGKIEI